MSRIVTVGIFVGCAFFFGSALCAQPRIPKCDQSLGLAKMQPEPEKGRMQDMVAPQTVHILELRNKAIPMLIACLTDETMTKEPIEHYWPGTSVGDIAFFYLSDLFTDSTGDRPTIDGVVNWKTLEAEYPGSSAATAWYEFVRKHGRKYVQDNWSKRWKEEQSAIFWDAKERCFKIGHPAKQ
jgi:hypothetical protein